MSEVKKPPEKKGSDAKKIPPAKIAKKSLVPKKGPQGKKISTSKFEIPKKGPDAIKFPAGTLGKKAVVEAEGLGKLFNANTQSGRANVAKATYAGIFLAYLYFRARKGKKPPPPPSKSYNDEKMKENTAKIIPAQEHPNELPDPEPTPNSNEIQKHTEAEPIGKYSIKINQQDSSIVQHEETAERKESDNQHGASVYNDLLDRTLCINNIPPAKYIKSDSLAINDIKGNRWNSTVVVQNIIPKSKNDNEQPDISKKNESGTFSKLTRKISQKPSSIDQQIAFHLDVPYRLESNNHHEGGEYHQTNEHTLYEYNGPPADYDKSSSFVIDDIKGYQSNNTVVAQHIIPQFENENKQDIGIDDKTAPDAKANISKKIESGILSQFKRKIMQNPRFLDH